jgi:putative flippase GtrA
MKFLKFLGVGGAATALHYIILMALVELLDANAVVATSTGYIISAVFNYTLNYHFTFVSKARHGRAFTKFTLVALSGLCVNGLIVYMLTELSLHYVLAQIAATATVTVINFIAHKYWTYKSA